MFEQHDFKWPDNYCLHLDKKHLAIVTRPYWNPSEWEPLEAPTDSPPGTVECR